MGKVGMKGELCLPEVAAVRIWRRVTDRARNQCLDGVETLNPIDDADLVRYFEGCSASS